MEISGVIKDKMNIKQTQEYKAVHDRLKSLLLADLEQTLPDRQTRANERYRGLQKAFYESFGEGVNLSIEGIKEIKL